ncbi:MAG: hypothetical protein J6P05_05415 [Lachnospiraceae bacterium]|nr:hypothetical protein [Lachnospiraceae bacterium]
MEIKNSCFNKHSFKVKAAFGMAALSLGLSGCGSTAMELTEAEEKRVVDYAANVLVDHDANFISSTKEIPNRELRRIVRRDLAEFLEEPEEEATEEAQEGGKGGTGGDGETAEEAPPEPVAIKDAIGLEGFDINYAGYEILTSYPTVSADGTSIGFGMDAAAGDKLLVMHFKITNTWGNNANCSVLSLNPRFQIKMSGKKHSILNTLLLDDLGNFEAEMMPGATEDTVLVAEIADADVANIKPLSLVVRGGEGDIEIPLEPGTAGSAESSPAQGTEGVTTGNVTEPQGSVSGSTDTTQGPSESMQESNGTDSIQNLIDSTLNSNSENGSSAPAEIVTNDDAGAV